jgi:hypothetical protein
MMRRNTIVGGSAYLEYRRCRRHVTGHRPIHEDSRNVKVNTQLKSNDCGALTSRAGHRRTSAIRNRRSRR